MKASLTRLREARSITRPMVAFAALEWTKRKSTSKALVLSSSAITLQVRQTVPRRCRRAEAAPTALTLTPGEADDAEVGFVVVEIKLGAGGHTKGREFSDRPWSLVSGALLTNKLEYFLVAGMLAQRVEIGVVLDPGFRLVIGVR